MFVFYKVVPEYPVESWMKSMIDWILLSLLIYIYQFGMAGICVLILNCFVLSSLGGPLYILLDRNKYFHVQDDN